MALDDLFNCSLRILLVTSAEEGPSQIFLEMLHSMVSSRTVSHESAEQRKWKAD